MAIPAGFDIFYAVLDPSVALLRETAVFAAFYVT